MLKSRHFQALVATLIALGMHICCCQVMPISVDDACGGKSAAARPDSGSACCHGHNHEEAPDAPEQAPEEPTHDCCGVHAKPLTAETSKTELPPLDWTVIPLFALVSLELVSREPVASVPASSLPAPETSLLRRHCALIV